MDAPDTRGLMVAAPPKPKATGKYPMGFRLLVGSVASFLVSSLLYGFTTIVQLLFFATVCTLGIGLLLILAACWAVGWVILEAWQAVRQWRAESRAG